MEIHSRQNRLDRWWREYKRRCAGGAFAVFSESRHRVAAYRIAGIPTNQADDHADELTGPATAAVVGLHLDERSLNPEDVTFGFHVITPMSSIPSDGKLIIWASIDSQNPCAVAIPYEPPEGGLRIRTRRYVRPGAP